MIKCPSCSCDLPPDSRFCPSCGAPAGSAARAFADTIPQSPPGLDAGDEDNGSSSDSIDQARFTPGTMLTERYRIVGLLGKGGMGEVYRADDLKLRQPVALKFLPKALADDPRRLQRFHNEVRVARHVSHPNVCRVYDIGEIEGEHFISMEYIDGEDLAALIRQIGRLPKEKAIQIARQLCAGLAAAHAKDVLHRDLKPHNVMIDGEGKVRITDFGLAGFGEEIARTDVRAGTPAYMAPEQLAGKEVSVRSDIYSLGLVLYEVFTGKRPFDEKGTSAILDRAHGDMTPATPSSFVEDMDPAVERVILRCLEHDPHQRPASALTVAAALPGGDPLAAALAAGETPSPGMVAEAGQVGGLRPVVAWSLLAAFGVILILSVLISDRASAFRQAALEKPPQALAESTGSLIRKLGYTDPPEDSAWGFLYDSDYMRYVSQQSGSPDGQDNLATDVVDPITFWYRQSPDLLVVRRAWGTGGGIVASVSLTDPPHSLSGMVTVCLDSRGRLLELHAVPRQVDKAEKPGAAADWSALFAQAALDPARFAPVASTWSPPVYADKATIFCANIAAGLMLEQFARWLRGLPLDADLSFNLLASECVVATPQAA